MKMQVFPLTLLFLLSSNVRADVASDLFGGRSGCLIVDDIESGKTVLDRDAGLCGERLYPCSTFKIPLALMAFDSGILRDEREILRWDKTQQFIKTWERDHDARSWLQESVVWFSQRLTPKLGTGRIEKYLDEFHYGNRDFSGGLTTAWLGSSLKISPREQIHFLRKLKRFELPVKKESAARVLSILPIEVDRPGFKIVGKTGSGVSWKDPNTTAPAPFSVGWYIGYFERDSRRYAFVAVFKEKTEMGKFPYSGREAKRIAIQALEELSK